MKRKYGWIKQKLDARDIKYSLDRLLPIKSVTLDKTKFPTVWNQQQLGACTSFGWGFAVMFDLMNNHAQEVAESGYSPSQLFIYFHERLIEGKVGEDSGAQIRDGAKAINKYGVCDYTLWPYHPETFTNEPTPEMLADALKYTSIQYKSIDNTNKQAIVDALQNGFPVVFGMSVYSSFESDAVAQSGKVPYPDVQNEKLLGGHCQVIVGYQEGDGDDDVFEVRNSWGEDWGQQGYCTIPTRYLCNSDLASDFWILQLIK